jgi:hypothetical protein
MSGWDKSLRSAPYVALHNLTCVFAQCNPSAMDVLTHRPRGRPHLRTGNMLKFQTGCSNKGNSLQATGTGYGWAKAITGHVRHASIPQKYAPFILWRHPGSDYDRPWRRPLPPVSWTEFAWLSWSNGFRLGSSPGSPCCRGDPAGAPASACGHRAHWASEHRGAPDRMNSWAAIAREALTIHRRNSTSARPFSAGALAAAACSARLPGEPLGRLPWRCAPCRADPSASAHRVLPPPDGLRSLAASSRAFCAARSSSSTRPRASCAGLLGVLKCGAQLICLQGSRRGFCPPLALQLIARLGNGPIRPAPWPSSHGPS